MTTFENCKIFSNYYFSYARSYKAAAMNAQWSFSKYQKQHSSGAFIKKRSGNIAATLQNTSMPKCDFKWYGSLVWLSPLNLLYIFRTTFYKNNYGKLLLKYERKVKERDMDRTEIGRNTCWSSLDLYFTNRSHFLTTSCNHQINFLLRCC